MLTLKFTRIKCYADGSRTLFGRDADGNEVRMEISRGDAAAMLQDDLRRLGGEDCRDVMRYALQDRDHRGTDNDDPATLQA